MKSLITTLALAGTLLLGTAAAQSAQLLPAADSSIIGTFYDGNPNDGGTAVEDAYHRPVTETFTTGNLGSRLHDVDEADYLTLAVGDADVVFEVSGADASPNALTLRGVNADEAITLAEVVRDISAALEGDADLAIFTDEDGVVTGFYSFEGNLPNVEVEDASTLTLTYQGSVYTYAVRDEHVSAPLDTVSVQLDDGSFTTLASLSRLID